MAPQDPRGRKPEPSGTAVGPTAIALFVLLAIVGAVVGIYALSASKKRAAAAEQAAEEAAPPKKDPFAGLPPDVPPQR
jgi:hypothetical protein